MCAYTYLFDEVNDPVDPLEGGATVAEPHGPPEIDRIQHQVPRTKVKLISDGEVLLGPDKLPVSITDKLQ